MLPVLISVGFVKIYTFGVFLVLAFFWSMYYLWRNIQLTAYKEEEVFDGMFLSLIGAALIGRVVYVVFNFGDFGFNIMRFILINGYPGFSMWGAILGFFLSLFLFANSRKMDFMELVDYFIPPALLGLAIGKFGAFFSGVEYGSVTSFPVALTYAVVEGARHITPLYEGAALFAAVFAAHRILFSIRRDSLSHGFLLVFFFWLYSLMYAVFDPIRGERVTAGGYSLYGMFSLLIVLTLSIYMVYYFRAVIWKRTIGALKKSSR